MNSGVYQILNKVDGKVYVGSTARGFDIRWDEHRDYLRWVKHYNPHLQNAYNKYGPEAFEYFVIEYCCPIKEILLEKEQFWMDSLKAVKRGYNIRPTAGSPLGVKMSEETKKKISIIHLGKKLSDAHKKQISEFHTGKVLSEETKKKMSKAAQGRKHSPESIEKMSKAKRGKKASEETKKKLSEARKGEKNHMFGKKHTYESINKMAESHRGKTHSDETKRKMSEDRKGKENCNTRIVVLEGKSQSVVVWAEELGINYRTLLGRLNNPKWTTRQALTTPIGGKCWD